MLFSQLTILACARIISFTMKFYHRQHLCRKKFFKPDNIKNITILISLSHTFYRFDQGTS